LTIEENKTNFKNQMEELREKQKQKVKELKDEQ
jgi:hypothetical protein